MEIFSAGKHLRTNTWYFVEVIGDLSFLWDHYNELHTFVIYDIDAKRSPYIHQLVVNIPGHHITEGDIIFDYTPPNPPINDPNHRYIIAVFLQPHRLKDVRDTSRAGYNLRRLINDNNLQFVDKDVLEVDPKTYSFFLRSKEDDPLDYLSPLIMPGANLSEGEKKYCSCVAKVTAKQSDECLKNQALGRTVGGQKCYDPYAVCAASTRHTSKQCGVNYNYDEFPKETARKYGILAKK
jgi:hypothetical protein